MSGDDLADLVDGFRDRVDHVTMAVKIIDFIMSHWWVILLCVLLVAFRPRGRRS